MYVAGEKELFPEEKKRESELNPTCDRPSKHLELQTEVQSVKSGIRHYIQNHVVS